MHRPTVTFRSLVSFTLAVAMATPLAALGQTTASQPDLFEALGEMPATKSTPRVASRTSSVVSGTPSTKANARKQAIKEIESTAKGLRNDLSLRSTGHTDIGVALGGAPLQTTVTPEPTLAEAVTVSDQTPAIAEPTEPTAAAGPPAGLNQRRTRGETGLDFISSTADSSDTGSTVPKVAATDQFGAGDQIHSSPAPVESQQQSVSQRSEEAQENSAASAYTVDETDRWNATNAQATPIGETATITASTPTASSAKAEQAFSADNGVATATDRDRWTPGGSATPAGFDGGHTDDFSPHGSNLLVTEQLPLITSRVSGPSKILIGREAKYRVTIENRGSASANELTTDIAAPEWADVVHAMASSGSVTRPDTNTGKNNLRWSIANLGAGKNQTLDVVLVPKTSQPLSLGVSWRYAPVATTTTVEVQEPKLAMAISGPDEVFFGRPQTYRLSLSNPGTGAAENVVVQLVPPGGGQAVSSYRVEQLAAGESKVVDIEITAREPGELTMQAVATADGSLRSEAEQQIFCRQAELNVDWRGPNRKYAGTEATYFFRVRNPGTASAEQVQFGVELPTGFEFADASEGHQFDMTGQRVTWKIGTLRPGDDCYLELRGTVNQAGKNELLLTAENVDGDVNDSKTASTEVVALADLKLDVSDPKGPVPVGSEIDYEIVVTNRGRSTAEQVNIIGLFSAGVEPVAAEGAEATITDGRVGFRTIGALPAGQKVRLKIRAKADSAGTHLFRAEVLCRDLEIKLAAEETTRFFQDEATGASGGAPIESASRASRFENAR